MTIDEIRQAAESDCVVCGEPFPRTRTDKKYCSNSCKNKQNYKNNGHKFRKNYQFRYHARTIEQQAYINARGRALREGVPFTITLEDIPPCDGICPITLEPIFRSKGLHFNNSPSLDRIDNSKGYEPGNIRVISYRANSRKGDLSYEEIKRLWDYVNDNRRD